MYYNIVCTDSMIKGLDRDFVSFQKQKVFMNLKKTKQNKDFVVRQMRHTRLGRFSLPEQVFMVIFCTLAVIFILFYFYWRLREPVDDAGSVGGCDTACREGLSCLSWWVFPSCPSQGPQSPHQHFTKAHSISPIPQQEGTSPPCIRVGLKIQPGGMGVSSTGQEVSVLWAGYRVNPSVVGESDLFCIWCPTRDVHGCRLCVWPLKKQYISPPSCWSLHCRFSAAGWMTVCVCHQFHSLLFKLQSSFFASAYAQQVSNLCIKSQQAMIVS